MKTQITIEDGRTVRIGDIIRITQMKGEPGQAGKEGTVELIDDAGQLHGNWSGLAVLPGEDDFEIIGKQTNEKDKLLEEYGININDDEEED